MKPLIIILIVQAGIFGEHCFTIVRFDARTSDYPGTHKCNAAPSVTAETQTTEIQDKRLQIQLPPATQIRLELGMERYVNQPSYKSWG